MIDLAAEIADCESVGVECALALALNFPRVYDTVPTKKSIIAAQPKFVQVQMIEPCDRTWVKVLQIVLDRWIDVLLLTGDIIRLPLSAIFAFA